MNQVSFAVSFGVMVSAHALFTRLADVGCLQLFKDHSVMMFSTIIFFVLSCYMFNLKHAFVI
ncbi:hypothetical protein BC829DRAFT_391504 [Chytridium lagenaria]|nr:hypothetical protein BC829DRAFT_391504 [Chytridium lagenaria]